MREERNTGEKNPDAEHLWGLKCQILIITYELASFEWFLQNYIKSFKKLKWFFWKKLWTEQLHEKGDF